MYEDITLLIDGKNAFDEIINCINKAKKNIRINMFVWRDDKIGNLIAQSILSAAIRGVKVELSIDREGSIFEHAEEYKNSFFHRKLNLIEKIKIAFLKFCYKELYVKEETFSKSLYLYNRILNHPQVKVEKDKIKKDHSKYYIIDDEILILGGINIEDKENESDISGRVYQDYMVEMVGKNYVESFIRKINTFKNINDDYYFGINYKKQNKRFFEMKSLYLKMINQTKKNLIIVMPYFQDIKKISEAIIKASKRGVKVKILIPKNPNYQKNSNYKCMKKLLKQSNNKIEVFLSSKMVHSKVIITDDTITIGSCNIAKKSFSSLSELNLIVKNNDSKFCKEVIKSVLENIALASRVQSYQELKFNLIFAIMEELFI